MQKLTWLIGVKREKNLVPDIWTRENKQTTLFSKKNANVAGRGKNVLRVTGPKKGFNR